MYLHQHCEVAQVWDSQQHTAVCLNRSAFKISALTLLEYLTPNFLLQLHCFREMKGGVLFSPKPLLHILWSVREFHNNVTLLAVHGWKCEAVNAVMCYSAGSRGVDENNEDYPSKEVKSNNNVLNFALTRKRVPKVTLRRSASFSVCSFGLLYSHLLLINHDCHIFRFFSLLFVFRKRRS